MTTRYQYILQFLQMRDAIAMQLLTLAAVLLAPVAALGRWPRLRLVAAVAAVAFVYLLFVIGVAYDLRTDF